MTVYDLKPAFQNLLRPLVGRLVRRGITPNAVTLAALMLSLLAAGAVALGGGAAWSLMALPIVLFVRMALNALDGIMAKEYGLTSRLGAYLNELGDWLSDTALILALAFVPGVSLWSAALFALGAGLSEFTGVLGAAVGSGRRYDGPMGKSDRALFLGIFALLSGLGILPAGWGDPLVGLAVALTLPTAWNRVRGGLR